MNNYRSKGEKMIKSLVKRYKYFRFSLGLTISFLMLGNNAFAEEITLLKEEVNDTSIPLENKIEKNKEEQSQKLSSYSLEFTKLMKQGDYVVKSPRTSWQFGINSFYDFNAGTYHGDGDKATKYSYEAPFQRSKNIFERSILPTSTKYSYSSPKFDSSLSSNQQNVSVNCYGLTTLKKSYEGIATMDLGENVFLKDPPKLEKVSIPFLKLTLPEVPRKVEVLTSELPVFPNFRIILGGLKDHFVVQDSIIDDPFIYDEKGNILASTNPTIPNNINVAAMGGQNIGSLSTQKAKIDLIEQGENKFQLDTENVLFEGIAKDGTKAFNYDKQIHGLYPSANTFYYSDGRDFTIKNTDIHIFGKSKYSKNSNFLLVNKEKPLSLSLENDTNIFVDAKTNALFRTLSLGNGNGIKIINNGNIRFTDKTEGSLLLLNWDRTPISKGGTIFENNKIVDFDGINNIAFLPFYGDLKIINNGEFSIRGSNNKGIYQGSTSVNRLFLAFHKALNIYGTDNAAMYIFGTTSILNPDSIIKVNLYGSNNIGIFSGITATTAAEFKNVSIKSIDGIKNIPFYYHGGSAKLIGGELSVTGGKENIALYGASVPTTTVNRMLESSVTINVSNSANSYGTYFYNSTGLINSGNVKVEGKGVKGFVFSNPRATATNTNTGSFVFHGERNDDGTPSFGVVSVSSHFHSTGLSDISVLGEKSTGLYVQNLVGKTVQFPDASIRISNSNIKAEEGAINLFATTVAGVSGPSDSKIVLEDNNILYTGAKSYTFLHKNDGKTIIRKPTSLHLYGRDNIHERGTAFVYNGTALSDFNVANFASWSQKYFENTLGNLRIQAKEGARIFQANDISLVLSKSTAAKIQAMGGPIIEGQGYKTFLLKNSKLTLDQNVNLDNSNDDYHKIEVVDSYVTNQKKVEGTQEKQMIAINKNEANAEIALSGDYSVAMYSLNKEIENLGKISVKGKSVAIYTEKASIKNASNASIEIGASSAAMYGSLGNVTDTLIKNEGNISSSGENAIGMLLEGSDTNTLFNSGNISLTNIHSKGMILKGNSASTLENRGEIRLGDSDVREKSVGIFSDSKNSSILNSGTIRSGNYGIGIYGYETKLDAGAKIELGNDSIGIYSNGKNVSLDADSTLVAGNRSIGVFLAGDGQTLKQEGKSFEVGTNSYGISNIISNRSSRIGNKILSTTANSIMKENSTYIYSNDQKGEVENKTSLRSQGHHIYGIYSAGKVKNKADIDFSSSLGSVGIFSTDKGEAVNYANIQVGKSDVPNLQYSIGMASDQKQNGGTVRNEGKINVNGEFSSGMFARGIDSTAINNGEIHLNANNTIGMFLSENARGVNNGLITSTNSSLKNISGVVLKSGSFLHNTANGKIILNSVNATGATLRGGTIRNDGEIIVTGPNAYGVSIGAGELDSNGSGKIIANGPNSQKIAKVSDTGKQVDSVNISAPSGATEARIEVNGKVISPEIRTIQNVEAPKVVQADSIGMYVDTSGVSYTKPIQNLGLLTERADLIIGAEAAKYTSSKSIVIEDPKILKPYNDSILNNPQVTKWDIYSGALTWIATATLDSSQQQLEKLYMVKRPYTDFHTEEYHNSYNFLAGLEQRYGVEKRETKEHKVFEKLNGIGKNEYLLFSQATDEMMGHQYANLQQRIHSTGKILDKEFSYLRKEWSNVSKDSNKVKVFGIEGEYKTNSAGVINYKNYAQGLVYVHENETVKFGRSSGWYIGFVRNEFQLKDIGKSKEEMYQGKLGYFRNYSIDNNGSLQWSIAGEGFLGRSKLERRYLVVDEIFGAKSKFRSYGFSLKNELNKEYDISENFCIKPYGKLNLEYGHFQKIREKIGEIRLEIKANDYLAIQPEVGVEFAHKLALENRKLLKTSLVLGYENELGRVGNRNNQAKVSHTTASYFNIQGEKENRRGNVKVDFNLGLENTSYGLTASIGYDVNSPKLRGKLGIRVIF